MTQKKSKWTPVTDLMQGIDGIVFTHHGSSWFKKSWQRALCYSSYYKFASKMIGKEKRVLDVGCGGGFGTWILAKECGFAKGVDLDREAIGVAQKNWNADAVAFECADLRQFQTPPWDAVVSFDVQKHILPKIREAFFADLKRNLAHHGMAILGIPGVDSLSCSLKEEMSRHFTHVFMFSANEEAVRAGVSNSAHYLIAVGCRKQ